MELILELLDEKRRFYLKRRTAVCLAAVASVISGTCHYLTVNEDYASGNAAALMPDICAVSAAEAIPDIYDTAMAEAMPDIHEAAMAETVPDLDTGDLYPDGEETSAPGAADIAPISREADRGAHSSADKRKTVLKKDKAADKSESIFQKNQTADNFLPPVERINTEEPGWIKKIIPVPETIGGREISGFVCNRRGYITGYRDKAKFLKDFLVVFPREDSCTGITKNALKGLEEEIFEIYITANITYIEEGAFDSLTNLVFIEADPGNPAFYSADGVLYGRDGKVIAYPSGLMK